MTEWNERNRNGVGYSFYTLQLLLYWLTLKDGSEGWLVDLIQLYNLSKQSKYSNRTVTAVVKKDVCRRVYIFVVYLVANQAYCIWL